MGGFYGTSSAFEFFFTVTCVCRRPGPYHRVLRLTALSMSVPSLLLLRQGGTGSNIVGTLAGLLVLTSIAYHTNHNPWLRALDMVAVVSTSLSGVLLCLASACAHGMSAWFAWCFAGAALLNAINGMEFSRERRADGSASDTIALRWHAAVHLLTAATLVLLAVGVERAARPG